MGKRKTNAIEEDLGDSSIFRHIEAQSGIFRTLCNPSIFRNLLNTEPYQTIKPINPGIFGTLSNTYDRMFRENTSRLQLFLQYQLQLSALFPL